MEGEEVNITKNTALIAGKYEIYYAHGTRRMSKK